MENRFFQSQSAIVAVSEVLWSGVIARALRERMFRRKCYSIRGHAWTQVLLGSRRVGGYHTWHLLVAGARHGHSMPIAPEKKLGHFSHLARGESQIPHSCDAGV